MKVLVVGEFRWEIYEKPLFKVFQELGYETYKFEWKKYLDYEGRSKFIEIIKRVENKFHIGPDVYKMNSDLVAYVKKISPELVFIYQGLFFTAATLKTIKFNGAKVFGYCNDDPFSDKAPKYFWRKYLSSCREYDLVFSYRLKNIDDYKRVYGIDSEILRSYYIEDRNYKLEKSAEKYECDVAFIGHYEDDGRDEFLIKVARSGHSFKVYGAEWHRSKYYGEFKKIMGGDVQQLRGDYNIALNSCKIALVFLSKINHDTYTRRCFEIPAAGAFMLSEYTDDLATLFEPDKEAVYFNNADELINKVDYYLAHDDERIAIAQNGYERVRRDGHEIKDRARQIIRAYERTSERN